jgi:hypothetical protein
VPTRARSQANTSDSESIRPLLAQRSLLGTIVNPPSMPARVDGRIIPDAELFPEELEIAIQERRRVVKYLTDVVPFDPSAPERPKDSPSADN